MWRDHVSREHSTAAVDFHLECRPHIRNYCFVLMSLVQGGLHQTEKRSHPAHGWKGRHSNWQRSTRWYQVHTYVVHNTYPTLKSRQFCFHTITKISRTHTRTYFWGGMYQLETRFARIIVRTVRECHMCFTLTAYSLFVSDLPRASGPSLRWRCSL